MRADGDEGAVYAEMGDIGDAFLQNFFAEAFAAHGWADNEIDVAAPFFQVPVQAVADIECADIFIVFDHPQDCFGHGFNPISVRFMEVAAVVVDIVNEGIEGFVEFVAVEELIAAFGVEFIQSFEEAFFVFFGGLYKL